MTLTYSIPGYPTVILTEKGEQIPVRPMEPGDGDALLKFFRRIPEEDRAYLKDDVTSPDLIKQWTEYLDYTRVVPLLSILDGRIIADATLHRRRPAARRHVGEVRVVVEPELRDRRTGLNLLRKLKVCSLRWLADREGPARRAAQLLGFETIAVTPRHILDLDGTRRDLIVRGCVSTDPTQKKRGTH